MELLLILITQKKSGLSEHMGKLLNLFIQRAGRYCPCSYKVFATEEKFLASFSDITARTRPIVLLADSRGDEVSSEQLAAEIRGRFDDGTQL